MKMWAHYERDRKGEPYMLVVTSDKNSIQLDDGDWIEEQQWIRFDQEPL